MREAFWFFGFWYDEKKSVDERKMESTQQFTEQEVAGAIISDYGPCPSYGAAEVNDDDDVVSVTSEGSDFDLRSDSEPEGDSEGAIERRRRLAAYEARMSKSVYRAFITVPRCNESKESLLDLMEPHSRFVKACRELHKKPVPEQAPPGTSNYHLHAFVQFNKRTRLRVIRDKLVERYDTVMYGRPDVRDVMGKRADVKIQTYLQKEGDFASRGEYVFRGKPKSSDANSSADVSADRNADYLEFIRIAREDGEEAAMQYASEELPREYLLNHASLCKAAKRLTPPPKDYRFTPPVFDPNVDTACGWQRALLSRFLDLTTKEARPPSARVIHVVKGAYRKGKSWLTQYLQAHFKPGVYTPNDSCSLKDIAYTYAGEGIILYDLPKQFDFSTQGRALARCLETFSNFGDPLRSTKYEGRLGKCLSHVVVFCNDFPTDLLPNRTVLHHDVNAFEKAFPPTAEDIARRHACDKSAKEEHAAYLRMVASASAPEDAAELLEQAEALVPLDTATQVEERVAEVERMHESIQAPVLHIQSVRRRRRRVTPPSTVTTRSTLTESSRDALEWSSSEVSVGAETAFEKALEAYHSYQELELECQGFSDSDTADQLCHAWQLYQRAERRLQKAEHQRSLREPPDYEHDVDYA